MHEGLELLKYFGFDDETFGVVLAICARAQGSTVPSIIASLEASAANGSLQARYTLAFYAKADAALQAMAAGGKAKPPAAG